MRHRTLLISIALMLALVAVACESAAAKPTAEPPTAVPTITATPAAEDASSTLNIREALSDPSVLECLSEQLGGSFDPESGAIGPELLGQLGGGELAMLESCGVDVGEGFGFATGGSGLFDPAVQECLAGELGEDIDLRELQRALFSGDLGEELALAFDACGVDATTDLGGRRGPGGFGDGGRQFGGGALADPEIQACLTEQLGGDGFDGFPGRDGDTGGGASQEDFVAAMEACGINLGDGGGGFFQFGENGGFTGRDDGIFGGGGRRGGGGPGGFGGPGGDSSFQNCLTDELGADAFDLLRDPTGAPSPEVVAALEKCGGAIAIPVEPDGGIGDGAGPIPIDPDAAPTSTPIPASELSIEQLTCLSGALEPAILAGVVIATSSGDLSALNDEALAALAACDVGS